jgi:hypothetical protein
MGPCWNATTILKMHPAAMPKWKKSRFKDAIAAFVICLKLPNRPGVLQKGKRSSNAALL